MNRDDVDRAFGRQAVRTEPVPRRIGVFCGAKAGSRPAYLECARELGAALGHRRIGLVYGGSAGGVMGAVATAAMGAGCRVIGVIPRRLTLHDPVKADIDECHVVGTMHERKSLMYGLSDSFIALPGGFGTLDELFETLTWNKIGLHRKPTVVLNVRGYFDALVSLLDHATTEGFLSAADRSLVRTADDVETAIELAGHVTESTPIH